MGGCCCSSRRADLNRGELGYQHFPWAPAEPDPFSVQRRFSAVSTDVLVDSNLETSDTEILQAPRPPSVPLGRTSNSLLDSQPVGGAIGRSCDDFRGSEVKTLGESLAESPKCCEEKKSKLDEPDSLFKDEEDVCPTCLEEYDKENPKIITNCGHHFHLSCILEWMERSDNCAVCNQAMIFKELGNL